MVPDKMKASEHIGFEIYDLAERIFPLCRSITGDGVRKTLDILGEYIAHDGMEFVLNEVPTGTQVFDWEIPKEWRIRAAYIEDSNGKRILDFADNNLHVVGYSAPVDKWVTLDELKKIVYTLPEMPEAVPYVTSYYKEKYGFCMKQTQWDSLQDGQYHIVIDSELFDGSLTYAEAILPGITDEELMISSYTCHPSMANNECSGPVVLSALMRYVNSLEHRRYTYRFVLNPETIGAITYLDRNLESLKKNLVAGVVLSCVGDDGDYSLIHTRYADTIADRSLKSILKYRRAFREYSFLDRGSDERQYNAPGVELPVVGFCRTKYGKYPEYHTSADNMDLISPAGLQGAYDVMVQWIDCMEANGKYRMTVLGEPQLGKRGLRSTFSRTENNLNEILAMSNLIAYSDGRNDLFDISEIIGQPPTELIGKIRLLKDNGLMTVVKESVSQEG